MRSQHLWVVVHYVQLDDVLSMILRKPSTAPMNTITSKNVYMLYPQACLNSKDFENQLLKRDSLSFQQLKLRQGMITVDNEEAQHSGCGRECAYHWQTSGIGDTVESFQWSAEQILDHFIEINCIWRLAQICTNIRCRLYGLDNDLPSSSFSKESIMNIASKSKPCR